MSVIAKSVLLNNFQAQVDEDAAAFFLGAGMSRPAGFVDWKQLMAEVAAELELDINRETDLIALAQWHKNTRKSRHKLNKVLVEEFTKEARLSENHALMAQLPVSTIWTTNYDQVIEEAYRNAYKRLDVKKREADLAVTKPRCHATLFKMHGDVDMPDEAVLTKEDFAGFERTRGAFGTQLRGHLVSKSFLFLGYSFSDPNMDYILARIRAQFGVNGPEHYCVMRRIVGDAETNPADVQYQERLQALRIDDLQNFGVQTLLVDEYSDITDLLRELSRRAVRKNVFVSGSAHDFQPLGSERLEQFASRLGRALLANDRNLVSGLGLGIGGAVAVGALEELLTSPAHQLDQRVLFRPFPQTKPSVGTLQDLWESYRQDMLARVGFVVFIAGNRLDDAGDVMEARGVLREFEISVDRGAFPIPVGVTGHAAATLAARVLADPGQYYRQWATKVVPHLKRLCDPDAGESAWVEAVIAILRIVAPK